MASGGPCKIIINSGNIAGQMASLSKGMEYLGEEYDLPTAPEIIKILNRMEDDACNAQKLFLTGSGYNGPLPKTMGG